MKRLYLLVTFVFIIADVTYAQRFERYLKHNLDSAERAYFNWKAGLKVVDEEGSEICRTEPLYTHIVYSDEADRAAVCLPLITLDNRGLEKWNQVWICLNYNLEPVFLFPLNTVRVLAIVDGFFLYTDCYAAHPYTFGLVDINGRVIFEPPYDKIYLENDYYQGIRNLTEMSDSSGIQTWAVEIGRVSSDSRLTIWLQTPDKETIGLLGDNPDDLVEDRLVFENALRESVFQKGLNYVVHFKMEDARKCFKEALNSKNPQIVRCAKYNLDSLNCFWVSM